MKTLLTGIALSLSALITTSAMAAPQHYDQRYDRPNTPHWSHDDRRYDDRRWDDRRSSSRVNPSREWRSGQVLPRQYDNNRYKVDYRDSRHLNKPARYQQWYKINGDYVLVNERNNRIIRILG
ncbi:MULTISPECIES: RcnB family protein [Acinetobacter]|uniref:RcnB family protein n=1 Tax=Acinetobacter TaxID=469 RepID=UPI000277D854|nr:MULTISPECIES: RcnB family protein [Acinetobacter]EJO36037.1 PF11776 domain protein [Acinetobacter radioresistens WC-A-157]EXF57450.1 hypothetical protein J502_1400 [Acinetobacter sp. 1294596]MCK4081132.1 RcnB family protein [Acinetobacter radioresistens]MCK4090002.1 RcnB family protein [Acinetobacter radioresistens]MCU4308144.1 RcnB family protein [Acinetobacter radioresistens]